MGFQVALQPGNLFFCFVGVLIGTLVGVLPGLGPVAAISLLLPTTFHITPVSAVIMLAGIYYGAMYGGSTTSILVNIPGEAASVVTCLDGYQMARQGRAGPALGIAAFGSFIAGTLAVIGLMLVAPPLAEMALKFGPPEYFSLMIVGLTILTFLASGPMWKALLMACFGLFLGCMGMDTIMGTVRFNFGLVELSDGFGLVPVVMGLFGISEVLLNVEQNQQRSIFETKFKNLLPTGKDWRDSIGAILRGSVIGFFLGILPGGGATISAFTAYAVEKKVSRHSEKFGQGAIEGVAAPESANNAATGGGLYSFAYPRHPDHRHHGHPFRGAGDLRNEARSHVDPGTSGPLLGRGGEHVRGKLYAPGSQPSLNRPLGKSSQSSLSHPVPFDSSFLLDRSL